MRDLDWKEIVPFNNTTISRMLLVATGVFTTIDLAEAVATEKYFVSVNYIGVGRFTVALGTETVNYLRVRNVKNIKDMYECIQRNTYSKTDYSCGISYSGMFAPAIAVALVGSNFAGLSGAALTSTCL